MTAPWHVRAWATGASLVINGALAFGVMTMNANSTMAEMDDTAMLVSLGDPSPTLINNTASPKAVSAPSTQDASAPAIKPIKPIKPPIFAMAPQAYSPRTTPPESAPDAAPQAPAQASAPAGPAAAPGDGEAMVATAPTLSAGSANARRVQAQAGSSNTYAAQVRAWLESHKTYPKAARQRRQQGSAQLVFVVDRAGRVLDCHLAGPTGFALLDQEALAIVARASPFPAPPAAIKGERIELAASVEFSLAQ